MYIFYPKSLIALNLQNELYSISFSGSFFLNCPLNTGIPYSSNLCCLLFSYRRLSLDDFSYYQRFRSDVCTINCRIDISRYYLSPKHHTHILNYFLAS